MGLEENLLNSSKEILGKLCEDMLPLNLTLYEEGGICTLEVESCGYCKQEKKVYFCYKKTYTFLPEIV